MDKRIILLGKLGDLFGREWFCSENSTLADIFKLIECQTPGFKPFMVECLEAGLDFAVIDGDDLIDTPEDFFMDRYVQSSVVYISLVPTGSGGFGKILAAVLIGVFAWIAVPGIVGASPGIIASGAPGSFAQTLLFGLATNLALAGVTELLTKPPKTSEKEEDGTLFNGPSNTTKAGTPIPILYGQLLIGGTAISINYRSTQATGMYGTGPGFLGLTYNNSFNSQTYKDGIPLSRNMY